MIDFAQLVGIVDPHTLGVLVAFWIRWEVWRRKHDDSHRRIEVHFPQPVEAPSHA